MYRVLSAFTARIAHDSYSENFLGVPFNISSYALLMHLVAHVCGLRAGDFVYTLGDYHIYKNHVEQVEELLSREPFPLPRLEIMKMQGHTSWAGRFIGDALRELKLHGYQSHGKIAAAVACRRPQSNVQCLCRKRE